MYTTKILFQDTHACARTFLQITPIADDDIVTIASGSSNPDVSSSFTVPTVYYGTYTGALDGGTNAFKKWYVSIILALKIYSAHR